MANASDVPAFTPLRFAQNADGSYVRSVPQTTSDPAAASFNLGFPPETFTDEDGGGSPPDGRDMNGVLNFLSAWAQWAGLAGPVVYNAAVSTNGGYPKGARVQSGTVVGKIWTSLVDGNTSNPDAGGANWLADVSTTYNDYVNGQTTSVVVPAWASHAELHVVGAGAAGGSSAATWCGGGGGSGAYVWGIASVTPGATIDITVGTGGAPAIGMGGAGGATTVNGAGLSIAAGGGFGGQGSTTNFAGGGPGTGYGLQRNFQGGPGNDGHSASTTTLPGGAGASGPWGGGGRSGAGGGVAGNAPGAGGGGAWDGAGLGGAGHDGCVLIRWLP